MNAVTARVLAALTLVAGAAVLFGPSPAAIAGGLLLALVLPGLALSATVFRDRTLSAVERIVLAPGLSLAVLVIGGLVIYVSGFELNRPAWTAATVGVTLVALVVPGVPLPRRSVEQAREAEIALLAAVARQATAEAVPAPLPAVYPVRSERPPVKRIMRQLIPMVLVLAVLGGAGWLSFTSSRDSYDITVTALSAAPPGDVTAAGARTVTVTVSGLVAADGPYRVAVIAADGGSTTTRTVPVPSNGYWSGDLSVGRTRTTINLYRASDLTAYRTLYVAAAP